MIPIDVVLLEKAYTAINAETVLSYCIQYDPVSDLCQECRFYADSDRHVKCPVWQTAFGCELQQQLAQLARQGIRINKKFLDIWYARKIQGGDSSSKRAVITHSAEVNLIASGGVPIVHMGKAVLRQKKDSAVCTVNIISMGGVK